LPLAWRMASVRYHAEKRGRHIHHDINGASPLALVRESKSGMPPTSSPLQARYRPRPPILVSHRTTQIGEERGDRDEIGLFVAAIWARWWKRSTNRMVRICPPRRNSNLFLVRKWVMAGRTESSNHPVGMRFFPFQTFVYIG
jgi:hypothetical protein